MSLAFDMAGICEPGLLELEPAPLCDGLITGFLELPEFNGQLAAGMARVNHAQGAGSHQHQDYEVED